MMQGRFRRGKKHSKITKFSRMESVLNDFPLCAPACEMASDEDDDNGDSSFPWLNFPLVEPFNVDTCWWKQHKFHAGRQPNNSSDVMNFPHFSTLSGVNLGKQSEDLCVKSRENEEPPTEVMVSKERIPEAEVATSSVCSANNIYNTTSRYPGRSLKRKCHETKDSDDMAEEESVSERNIAYGRTSSKRGRVAQVHSLSERRRRERINEKMRALQELIPNCNKADRASMLDEAIEYMKTLQLQVQIMSVGAGMYLPPMMFPAAIQNMQLPSLLATPPMSLPLASVDVPVLPPSYQMLQNAILQPHMTKQNSQ